MNTWCSAKRRSRTSPNRKAGREDIAIRPHWLYIPRQSERPALSESFLSVRFQIPTTWPSTTIVGYNMPFFASFWCVGAQCRTGAPKAYSKAVNDAFAEQELILNVSKVSERI